jgi:transcriptional regulator with XRE-family HTH domain
MLETISIGKRLKKRRLELGFSLRELAKRTQLTASFLSQAEREVTNPSLNSLRRVAEALNVPMLYFLAENTPKSPVVRKQDRPQLDLDESNVAYELLTPDLSGEFEVICGALKPGVDNIVRPLGVDTQEFIMVLQGSLLVGLADADYILETGDTIYFDGKVLRKLICASDQETRWISVITPPVF